MRPFTYCSMLSLVLLLCSCQFLKPDERDLMFNPVFQRAYHYTLSITSSTSQTPMPGNVAGFQTYDTIGMDFTLKNIYYTDTSVVCKLIFDNFRKKRPGGITVFFNMPSGKRPFFRDPYSIFDSMGTYIHGLSVQVVVSKKGVVKEVAGVGDLMEDIARAGNRNERDVRVWMRDFVGAFAISDLLNRVFSVIPEAPVKQDDRWVRNITLETKAPVKISNLNTFQQRRGDTVFVNIESIVSAEQSDGGTVYMKGKQSGHATVNYSSGMPTLYETSSETVTTTSHQYQIIHKEHFLLQRVTPPVK